MRDDNSWQKDDASSANNKDTCLDTVQRNQATRTMPLLVLNPPVMPHLLLESKLHMQMMKKRLSLHQNQRKGLMMSSTPSGTLIKERDKS
jgi:hypothetical protein